MTNSFFIFLEGLSDPFVSRSPREYNLIFSERFWFVNTSFDCTIKFYYLAKFCADCFSEKAIPFRLHLLCLRLQ